MKKKCLKYTNMKFNPLCFLELRAGRAMSLGSFKFQDMHCRSGFCLDNDRSVSQCWSPFQHMPFCILCQLGAQSRLCIKRFQAQVTFRWRLSSTVWWDFSGRIELWRFVLSTTTNNRSFVVKLSSLVMHSYVSQIDFLHPTFVVQIALFFCFTHVNPVMQAHDAFVFHLRQENVLEATAANFSHAARVEIKPNCL